MNKALKKAVKNYKKKVRQPVTIEFDERHLPTILKALEVYQRLKLGQIDYALDEAFGCSLDHEASSEIHRCARKHLIYDLSTHNLILINLDSYYPIHCLFYLWCDKSQ
jgi:hypothetical protein